MIMTPTAECPQVKILRLEKENEILEGATEYWQEAALAARAVLQEIATTTPHQHIRSEISTFLKRYEGDTDEQ